MHKRHGLLGIILILTAGMVVGWGSGVRAQTPGQGIAPSPQAGGITFSRGDWVYYLAPGQQQPQKLVKGLQAALSPDGKKVAYVQAGEVKGLMVLDLASGRSATLVAPGPDRLDGPAWSPQGQELAFIEDLKTIQTIKADGSGRQKIFSVPGGCYVPPAWTSGGKSLLVNDLNDLYQIDLTGKQLTKTPLTTFTGKADAVSSVDRFVPNPAEPHLWAFTMAVPGTPKFDNIFHEPQNALFLFDTRTMKRSRLTPPDMLAMYPCWSRDGQVLYFSGYREPHYKDRDPFRIYRINRDGTGLTEVARGENPSQ